MIGAIMGDVVGSIYESPTRAIKTKSFPLFGAGCGPTDDSVLTLAVAEALMSDMNFARAYRKHYARYPDAGFGSGFVAWTAGAAGSGRSYGNGAAMRVSPIGFWGKSLQGVLDLARQSAVVTHDDPRAIKSAQAVAAAIFLARSGRSKAEIARAVAALSGYDLTRKIAAIRAGYGYDLTADGSVPEAIVAFLESSGFEDAIRNAVSLGGDSDTQAAIAGGIAEAYYGIPLRFERVTLAYLDEDQKRLANAFARFRGRTLRQRLSFRSR